uniref:DUF929 domain-containing protein n=1 Tax=Thermosporothrix sp. COM3 TaxID=2490863 RepID=A0A455SFY6_9CHLR|nr:hypothetical protein KTC_11610 [Thermosporothrix sp. COM3]
MPKHSSATRRREQTKNERRQRLRSQRQGKKNQQKPSTSTTWILLGSIIGGITLIIALFLYQASSRSSDQLQPGQDTALKAIPSLKPELLEQVGTGSLASNPMTTIKNTPILKGKDGKPVVLYVGAEYCPFCAGQRWAMIIALSRFGSFGELHGFLSGEGNIPSYSFYQGSYTSHYIDFQGKETGDNTPPPATKQLDTLTEEQQHIVDTYNTEKYLSRSGIPFIDIANRYISSGAYFPIDLFYNVSYQEIGDKLQTASDPLAQGVIGAANYLTAAICVVTTTNQRMSVTVPRFKESRRNWHSLLRAFLLQH